jgi:hypothetical protein
MALSVSIIPILLYLTWLVIFGNSTSTIPAVEKHFQEWQKIERLMQSQVSLSDAVNLYFDTDVRKIIAPEIDAELLNAFRGDEKFDNRELPLRKLFIREIFLLYVLRESILFQSQFDVCNINGWTAITNVYSASLGKVSQQLCGEFGTCIWPKGSAPPAGEVQTQLNEYVLGLSQIGNNAVRNRVNVSPGFCNESLPLSSIDAGREIYSKTSVNIVQSLLLTAYHISQRQIDIKNQADQERAMRAYASSIALLPSFNICGRMDLNQMLMHNFDPKLNQPQPDSTLLIASQIQSSLEACFNTPCINFGTNQLFVPQCGSVSVAVSSSSGIVETTYKIALVIVCICLASVLTLLLVVCPPKSFATVWKCWCTRSQSIEGIGEKDVEDVKIEASDTENQKSKVSCTIKNNGVARAAVHNTHWDRSPDLT